METGEVQRLVLEAQKRLSMTGVAAVDGFSDRQIRLSLSNNRVCVNGTGLKITAFNKSTGNLQAEGVIHSVIFDYKREPIVKRLFK